MSDYKSTLNLPVTSFPMKANLIQKEPEMLKEWEENKAYEAMVNSGGEKGMYALHDGPPYANGHIHLGHALNKVLKDIIVKSRNMQGYKAPYVPGWDCHGLPIEHKVEQDLKAKKKELPPNIIRKLCREYATKWLDVQRKEFKRLGVFGTWEQPYISMDPSYEAATAKELGNFMAAGSVVRSKKPIYWCNSCHTALAEAEVEYAEHTSPSIFVRFKVEDPKITSVFPKAAADNTWVVIWTTTPWTLPDNMAVAVHPEFDYALVEVEGTFYIVADELVESCRKAFGWVNANTLAIVKGEALEHIKTHHPFYDRESPIVLGRHVTLEAGTGCVHTAPGHGREDYDVALEYDLEILSPIDDSGVFLPTVPLVGGQFVFDANKTVIDTLLASGHLMTQSTIEHSYPHCWRCKSPVIFRATTQWFISMERNHLRTRALEAIRNEVKWIPSWGEERIYNMIEFRPDWCISRQRTWGVPITALLCKDCGEAWFDASWNKALAEKFEQHPTGCDYWFETPVEELTPAGLACPSCGGSHWEKETDILDVWFDSGTSFAAVVEKRPECHFPANMYLEGSDQHRGWFHSSLLASIGTRGTPPYKEVLTHGYVVDGEGKKMSKSLGNGIEPSEIINQYGAEILRMWVSSVEYREDVRISKEILNRQVDAYRRIRNTCRYILGNLGDFTQDMAVSDADLLPLDAYALDIVTQTHNTVQAAYENYEFHKVFHALHNLCVTDLSAFYLDILKDRLYTSGKNSHARRSAQTALWRILLLLVADMAPVLSFTAEEVLKHTPEALKPAVSTVFAMKPEHLAPFTLSDAKRKEWGTLLDIRAEVTKNIEPMRKAGEIGHALDTAVTLYLDDNLKVLLEQISDDLRSIFIVSQLQIESLENAPADAIKCVDVPGLAVKIAKAAGEKCARCWIYSTELGSNPEYPGICPRCTQVLLENN